MNFIVSHICRERNCCVDKLANINLSINSFDWMYDIPPQAGADFFTNRLDLSCFRFVTG